MKPPNIQILTKISSLALAVGLCQPAAVKADPFSLGSAANYALLEIGNGNISLAAAPPNGFITGNVGAAGGNLSDGGNLPITGSVFLGAGATSSGLSGNVSGTIHTNFDLSSAISAATTASSQAAALASSGGGVGFTSISEGNNVTLNLAPGVYNLTNFSLHNGDIVNLEAGGSYVFNISGSLSLNSAEILAAAGLTPSDILFNITGTQGVQFSGGLNNESVLDGIILAPDAQVSLTPGALDGEIISGQNINIASGGSVQGVTSSVPEPSSAMLLSLVGCGFLAIAKRRLERRGR
jgi:choice-of-anchor A domain-containing protein